MTKLAEIELATQAFADAYKQLSATVTVVTDEAEAIYRQHRPALKAQVNKVADRKAKLAALIAAAPELFNRPKSMTLAGIKIGFRKGTGAIEWDDDASLVKLIRKHLPDLFDTLVSTKETPKKKALGELPAADLKRLGVTVEDTGDVVFIVPTDSNVDKAIAALLKEKTNEQMEVAA